jgi:hypothetical protein
MRERGRAGRPSELKGYYDVTQQVGASGANWELVNFKGKDLNKFFDENTFLD